MKPTTAHITKVRRTLTFLSPAAGLAASVLFLNVLMNINHPSGDNQISRLLLPTPEILVILILLSLGAWLQLSNRTAVFLPLTLLIIFLRLFRWADNFVPAYFFRPFNLYLDSQLFPDLVFLLYSTVPLKVFILWSVSVVLIAALIVWGIWRAPNVIFTFLSGLGRTRQLAAATIVVGILACSQSPLTNRQAGLIMAPGIVHRVAAEFDFILNLSDTMEQHQAVLDQAVEKSRQFRLPLSKLKGSDVYIFFVESYGHTVFADPRHAPLIEPFLEDVAARLMKNGYRVGSNFLQSPAFGGSSWLAHGALASGVTIDSQLQYDLLLTSRVQPLAEYFNRTGYRTVSVMPGTLWPWPAGKFFEYQKKYYASDFDYRGPKFGWAPMADQYVLDSIYRTEIQNGTQPLFIEFVLISSHAPFNELPPYVPDWETIGDGSLYHHLEPVRFPVVWPELENASEAFVTSIIYDFKVIVGFLEQMATADAIVIIVGDHQPNIKITGPDQPWSVPVHVVSRNPDFISPFIEKGYIPGLIPNQALPHAGIESIFWHLLGDFG